MEVVGVTREGIREGDMKYHTKSFFIPDGEEIVDEWLNSFHSMDGKPLVMNNCEIVGYSRTQNWLTITISVWDTRTNEEKLSEDK